VADVDHGDGTRRAARELIVIGGGYVGMAQAQLFAGLGTRVTLVGRLAPHAEPKLADVMREVFPRVGITVVEQRAVKVAADAGGVQVTTGAGHTVTGRQLLLATGRGARTDGLDLAAAGIEVDERGFITVDARQQTSNPKVWAAGDVSGAPQYVYVAAETGRAAAVNALGGKAEVDYTGLPAVTFTRPQIASAGLTEAQALAAGHACDCRVLAGADIPRALANQDTLGALKIVVDADTRKVLGVHAALDGAGDVMLAATYVMKAGMTADDIADTWAPYLTMSEALRIAAGLFRTDKPTSAARDRPCPETRPRRSRTPRAAGAARPVLPQPHGPAPARRRIGGALAPEARRDPHRPPSWRWSC
jgi:mercuric reductase